MKSVMKRAVIDALGTTAYVAGVAYFMFSAGQAKWGTHNTLLIPIVVLMLLVFSVAIVGWLIFGKPVLLYLDGKKKEAVALLGYTLGILAVITLGAIGGLISSVK